MTTIEMQRSFLSKSHTLDRTDLRNLSSFDIITLLNQAQDIVINDIYSSGRYIELNNITTSFAVTSISSPTFDTAFVHGIAGAKCVSLSGLSAFRYYIRSQSKLSRSAVPVVSDMFMVNIPVENDIISYFETNGVNKPIFQNPKEIRDGQYLVVLGDAYTTISEVHVVYVRNPLVLVLSGAVGGVSTTTCELPAHVHERVVDVAIEISGEILAKKKQ